MVTAPFVEPERRLARFGYFAECPNAIRFTRMNQLFQHSHRAGGEVTVHCSVNGYLFWRVVPRLLYATKLTSPVDTGSLIEGHRRLFLHR